LDADERQHQIVALARRQGEVDVAPIFLVGFISSEGLFLAWLCAAATIVSPPVLIAGWLAQNKLVRGLSMGAVK
jgi:ABC-type glycerol-3-phosphate transport system permease component